MARFFIATTFITMRCSGRMTGSSTPTGRTAENLLRGIAGHVNEIDVPERMPRMAMVRKTGRGVRRFIPNDSANF
ncbi:MAG: hypothetical protein QOI24_2343 [Acidobacteriota bacterium]|nr:hypothetical protein [Acidobacteriota bacterium]